MLQKIIVATLNKLPWNGWKTEIGLLGLAVVFFLAKFGVVTMDQATLANQILVGWTGVAFVHSKNK